MQFESEDGKTTAELRDSDVAGSAVFQSVNRCPTEPGGSGEISLAEPVRFALCGNQRPH